jgi:hypothetical protein
MDGLFKIFFIGFGLMSYRKQKYIVHKNIMYC